MGIFFFNFFPRLSRFIIQILTFGNIGASSSIHAAVANPRMCLSHVLENINVHALYLTTSLLISTTRCENVNVDHIEFFPYFFVSYKLFISIIICEHDRI